MGAVPWAWPPAGAGAGAAFPAAHYSGHDETNLAWGSATWAGVATALDITDVEQIGITRAGSVWTFAAAGDYVLDLQTTAFRTVAAQIAFRARLAGVTVGGPAMNNTESSSRLTMGRLYKRLSLAAGAAVTLEYCVSSSFASVAATVLDGETCHTCGIEIFRYR